MFNLEQAIADWRRQMLAAGIKAPVPLEELESHLREEIGEQVVSGLGEEEAFYSAAQQIGPVQVVRNEFQKVETAREDRQRRQHLQSRLTIVMAVVIILYTFHRIGHVLSNRGSLTAGPQTISLAGIGACALLFGAGWLSGRIFPVIRSLRIGNILSPSDFWLAGYFAILFLPCDSPLHTMLFIWVWFVPMGAFLGLYWGIQTAARKKVTLADL